MKRIVILFLTVVLLIPMVVSCTPANPVKTSNLGLEPSNYHVQNGWIYYSDLFSGRIYKIRSDGKEKTEIYNLAANNFVVYNDSIFYSKTRDAVLYRCRTDGSDQTFLCEKNSSVYDRKLEVVDGWVYFWHGDFALCKIKADGSELTKFTDRVWDYSVDGEWVYYTAGEYKDKMV